MFIDQINAAIEKNTNLKLLNDSEYIIDFLLLIRFLDFILFLFQTHLKLKSIIKILIIKC